MRRAIWGFFILASVGAPALAGARQDRAKAAGVAWGKCVLSKAQIYARQQDAADILATAAMGACLDEANTFHRLLSESTREYGLPFASKASEKQIDDSYSKIESQLKSAAITTIIDARSR